MDIAQTSDAKRPRNLVQTIERVDRLLGILGRATQALSLGELAEAVGLPKGTAHRLLSSLVYFSYVQQDPVSRGYRLGFKLVTLGNYLLDQIDLRKVAQPHLLELAQHTKETANLAVLDQGEVLYIDKIQLSSSGLHMSSSIGYRAPLHCSAMGKVLLAHQPDAQIDRIIARGLPRRTAKTIIDGARLKTHLQTVRAEGYALDDEEHSDGVRCVAAPIRDMRGEIVAAISISAPAVRVTQEVAYQSMRPLVVATASKIANQLGYQPTQS